MLVYTSFFPLNLICNIQILFWSAGKNICFHAAAFVIPFNLICNMTMFWKSWIKSFWPHPLSLPRESDPGLQSTITFDMFHIYCTSVCMQNFSKKYWQLTELLWNLNILPFTPPKGSGPSEGWYKISFTVMLIYWHGVNMVYSEKLSDNSFVEM